MHRRKDDFKLYAALTYGVSLPGRSSMRMMSNQQSSEQISSRTSASSSTSRIATRFPMGQTFFNVCMDARFSPQSIWCVPTAGSQSRQMIFRKQPSLHRSAFSSSSACQPDCAMPRKPSSATWTTCFVAFHS
ncbi:uncharacterized protein LOC120321196 isoform X1 [Drosophila yakuba]|uniref:uncharacterized protein LOC120321196 isoform X1 n=1 Tax=Drosophila yakuba TaxID=7245 RepID=UPI0019307835|nr:uncharacterized protein LOC120321196 isoform X1 [Drosophila yakuba]